MALDLLTDHSQYIVGELQFMFYSSDEIRKLSVKEILNPQTFDDAQHSSLGGLYDPALGPLEHSEQCTTCSLGRMYCPGHMGHIELPVPVYHPLFFDTIYTLLRSSCLECLHIAVDKGLEHLFINQSKLLDKGCYTAFGQLEDIYHHTKNKSFEELKDSLDKFTEDALRDKTALFKDHLTRNRKELRNSSVKKFIKQFGQSTKKCPNCKGFKKPLRKDQKAKIVVVATAKVLKSDKKSETKGNENEEDPDDNSQKGNFTFSADVILLTPSKVKEIFRKLWTSHAEMLKRLYPFLAVSTIEFPTDSFFLDSLAVPPNRYRPISEMKDMKFEHTQTANLHKVLVSCVSLREILNKGNEESVEDISNLKLQKKTYLAKLGDAMVQLQRDVNMVMDKASDGTVKDAQPGIRQLLESKEGLFRKNIMGKRVNHACRSVISPDPNISTNEIGIPEVFALELTYPQPVTPWNVHELRRAVINGPKKHPGAVSVTNENGIEIMLDPKNKTRREAIAKQLLTPSPTSSRIAVVGKKTVHRHLKNGDMLLLNRQPTLHKPSIQGHMARVLKGEKTMRMNYMNCKAYNADFDGDEMSAHFPQSELCRSEAYHITSTDFQYLGPKDGTPLAGLMQDHIVSGVHLSIKGKFFCKEDYCSLVNSAVFDKQEAIKILPPAILKPYRSYTGKQIVSTVLLNVIPEDAVKLTFNGKAKIPEKSWINTDVKQETPSHMGESDVVIRGGELLVGIFDKQHLGATSYGLIHCVNELYGGRVAGRLLTCFGRLFLHFLKFRGFTLGIEDILVKDPANEERKKIIKKSCKVGPTAAKKALDLPENTGKTELLKTLKNAHFDKDDRRMRELDLSMRGQTNEIQNSIATTIMPHGLIQQFPANNLQLMVKSGSKGSLVNTMQISCLLGQIELEGKRPPIMLSGKSLPSFAAYDVSPRAGGFVSDRFLTGVRPQEYFFHCMAGREGLVDTAVKTSRSGYLQRCIIKHLEGIKVHYDYTVRDADNSIVQFHYGEDALDVSKASFLNTKQLPFLAENSGALKGNIPLKDDDYKLIRKTQKTIDDWGTNSKKIRRSGFLHFCSEIEDSPHTETEMQGRENKDVAICERWSKLRNKKRKKFSKNCKIPDPLLSTFWPYQRRVFPEKQLQLFRDFIHKQYDKDDEQMSEDFLDLMDTKMKHSLAEPGEAVGLLCAQSIGEPSTQMTLNTFHFAGRNEMNMTLGIPRLREILMTGSKMIKTPSIDVPVFPGGEAKKSVKALQKWLNKVHLSDVLEVAEIETWLSLKGERARVFHVTFKFLPYECYKQSCCVTPKFILKCMEKKFFKDLVATILYNMSKLSEARDMTSKKEKKTKEKDNDDDTSAGVDKDFVSDDLQLGNNDDGDDESDDSGSDGDDYTKKLGKKHADEKEYEDDEVLDDTGVAVEDEDVDPGMLDENFESNKVESDDEDMDEGDLEETLIRMEELKSKDKENDLLRVNNVLQIAKEIVGYKYDAKNCRSCELTLKFPLHDNQLDISGIIKKLAIKTVLHQVPGISKCYLGEEQGDRGKEFRLKTEGINVGEICKHSKLLDLDRLYCNNIHTVENTHGIEAARNVIIMEMQRVFGAYGIDVDYRHLSLLSDYMTFEGTYKPFTRRTMASNASPLQRMSYETSMTFLIDACINAEVDDLSSPSSQITVGKNISFGTGAIDMMVPLTL